MPGHHQTNWGVHFHPLSLPARAAAVGPPARGLVRECPAAVRVRPLATGVRASLLLHAGMLLCLWLAGQLWRTPAPPQPLDAGEVALRLPAPRGAPQRPRKPPPAIRVEVSGIGPAAAPAEVVAPDRLALLLPIQSLPGPVARLRPPPRRLERSDPLQVLPAPAPEDAEEGGQAVSPEPVAPLPGAAGPAVAARRSPLAPLRPVYPRRCQRRACQGRVELALELDAEGRVTAVEIVHSSGCEAMDQAALEAAREALFTPGAAGNAPLVVHFRLRS